MTEDIFDRKQIRPMLLVSQEQPFDSRDFIFEVKFDGARMLAYIDKDCVHLENRSLNVITHKFPEFNNLHKQVKQKCILDGELVYIDGSGKPDFTGFQARNNAVGELKKYPMSFVVFDILYLKDKQITGLPLTERKVLLQEAVVESENFLPVRFVEEKGKTLFNLTKKMNLEGIVAKKKDSAYKIGKRTENWIKIKHLQDDEFLICGYIFNEEGKIKDLLLCSKTKNGFKDEGEVYLGMNKPEEKIILKSAQLNRPVLPDKTAYVVWIEPKLICKVEYLHKTEQGKRRHGVFKGLVSFD